MKKIMVFGTFDGLHPGHEFVLTEAMKQGKVIVIVARDTNVRLLKGRLPIVNEAQRKEVLQKRFPSLTVVLGDQKNFLTPVLSIQPDKVLLGYDQKLPPGIREEDLGCTVERLKPFHPDLYKSSLLSKKKRGIMSR